MDNQMKVCFITLEQFDVLWKKSQPQERMTAQIPTSSFMSLKMNTLFIVGKQEDFLVDPKDAFPSTWFSDRKPIESTEG